jgi:subtilase family serine protease
VAFVSTLTLPSFAQKRVLVREKIDRSHLTTLYGNTRREANANNDQGPVSADLVMDHMMLVLQRPAELDQAAAQFVDDLHSSKSPNFHKWISAADFGARFGPAQADIDTVTQWLTDNGFTVNVIYPSGMMIDFSGTASQVESAFGTQIRNYRVAGIDHIANARDPRIPTALAGVIKGVASLHDFKPRAFNHRVTPEHINPKNGQVTSQYTFTSGGQTFQALVPSDLQTIYNITPLLNAGISGQGTKIVLIEDTNQFNCNAANALGACSSTSDWAVFRRTFGLAKYPLGTLTQDNPAPATGTNNCTNPGTNGDAVEASIDVQWAAAAAPSAALVNSACRGSRTTFGGLIAVQNILSQPNANGVNVISMSYGESETAGGAALNASFNNTFQQAAAAGVAVFVSSGDEDAASADNGGTRARDGITVSGWMSSPYDVSVGGLDFADTYLDQNSKYWNATNNVFYGSAKSYIPEQPWNDSCAGTLLAQFETGSPITYGDTGFCNTTEGANFHLAVGGSGGPSNCATGAPATSGVANGTCAGWAKPTYQSTNLFAGEVNDGVRDTPDVSLMAANGLWGHYYIICYSNVADAADGGTPCVGQPLNWPGFGGTSVSSPIMAAIQALVIQHKGTGNQGLPNYRYYQMAATEYGASGSATCNSSLGNAVGKSCAFYDVTLGDIIADCQPKTGTTRFDCYLPSGAFGALSTDNNSYQPAYPTTTGWDFATGIGSVNAYNLVMQY